jgi:F420-non-reducing hydrogenase small subunit
MPKPTFAMYWAAACGGCEVSLLNIGMQLLDLDAAFEIVFWPCVADFKYHDVEGYPDGYIDLCLFNGSIRNSENEELAHLLRRKSKTLVAFGSCAAEGCVPGLANLTGKAAMLETIYSACPSNDETRNRLPQPVAQVPEGEIRIPQLYETVRTLGQVVPVDYIIPGCPPEAKQISTVIAAITSGTPLPPPGGTLLGAANNYALIAMSVKKAAQSLIRKGVVVTEGLLNRIEMGFRAYDPFFGCATHALPGQMPLEVVIRDAVGGEVQRLSQYV